ncbi:MAG: 23S rRNA (uracil(1939)-C(5))-methyltransferase RlmD [Myxococcales bacterium]|nr:23S rRNA (uracil(1939)-C(5))-methyltransferase RlmD [Myxococcales bacterium]
MSIPRYLVTARTLAPDGHGIAFEADSAKEFWVKDLLPGEAAWVEVQHDSPHREQAWARIVERASITSAERTASLCPVFGECGGCAWQHLSIEGQREEKRRLVASALSGVLGPDVHVETPKVARHEGYRNKGKYVVSKRHGEMVLGAYKPRSHEVVSTLGCRVVEPAIDSVARHTAQAGTSRKTPIYREGDPTSSGLRYVIVRSNEKGEALVLLVCTADTPADALRDLGADIMSMTSVVGVLRCDNDHKTGVLLTDAIEPLFGSTTIQESAAGVSIELGPSAFWQLNREQASLAFADLAGGLALPAKSQVVELYCGVGAISFALAAQSYQVHGIENNSDAIRSAQEAAANGGHSEKLQFVCADATTLDPAVLARADAVVVDPPRKGLGASGTSQLLAARPQAIAYLSCGLESLSRDLAALTAGGYRITSVQLYDFMPGTSQIESLVQLRRSR